jgi:23S rRNA pseudouridine1911/1915/1917 synthase
MPRALEHVVTREQHDATVSAVVRGLLALPWTRAKALCASGRVTVDGALVRDPGARVLEGQTVVVTPDGPRRDRRALGEDALLHVDRDVAVVLKPAGIDSVPYERGDKDTFVDLVRALLRRRDAQFDPQLGVVQRLDRDTTGVMVFARTVAAKKHLQQQFRRHSIGRRYLAIAHGLLARPRTFETHLLRDRGDGLRGSWGVFRRPRAPQPPADAERAVTHVRPLESLRGATLVECRLETGRQHQIRIHLAEAGHPLVGERVYIRDYDAPRLEATRPMLHAAVLAFEHPRTGERLRFEQPPPADFEETLARLRG